MKIPDARGPISGGLFRLLADGTGDDPAAQGALHVSPKAQLALTDDVIDDGDVQLALFCLYELHYGGLDGVDDRWEWNPGLIALRQLLEEPFERALRSAARSSAGSRPACPCRGPGQRRGGGHPVRDRGPGRWTGHVPPRGEEGDPRSSSANS